MHRPSLFDSFFLGGFECSTHRRHDGRRLDLIEATGHGRFFPEDYAAMTGHGMRTVRDGVRWHLIETSPGRFDWSSFLPMLHAARAAGVQVIWDLCHYGWPDDIDIWQPNFVDRFAAFAAAVAQVVKDETGEVPFYAPINEISYWAWAGGDNAAFNPMARGRGMELKVQLVRASIAAIEAIREVEPRARFVQIDPVINVVAKSGKPGDRAGAEGYRQAQYQAWDMLTGRIWPGLGGKPDYLDTIGVNYYSDNQWFHGGGMIERTDPHYRPFRELLAETHKRYGKPVLVAETGAEGDPRAGWFRYVCDEVAAALEAGTPVEGICLYPVVDYPGWADERHCATGLLGFPDAEGRREVHHPLADELAHQVARFGRLGAAPELETDAA
ncbi:beta-glucosidase (plasmid) [Skermanella sp. TT6]|uniref:Beta-glucosidase n=1 Tax=Skermanella cutis TaxID=2775420 RepID=A0ABX7BMT2_9PROT|nr:beta-glucosidase [Skermanella sp. TT6]QQP93723.1 beta-glucosidase [Skermanella sp. TT6]